MIYQKNGITIVGVKNGSTVNIGVTKCSNNQEECTTLGVEIARGRAEKKPMTTYKSSFRTQNAQLKEFYSVAGSIALLVENKTNWSNKNYVKKTKKN